MTTRGIMRHYETTFILRPNLGEEQTTEID